MPIFNLSNGQDYERATDYFASLCMEGKVIELGFPKKQRTTQQNRALHKLFSNLSQQLNDAGLDVKKVLSKPVDVPWNEKLIKELIWRPMMKATTGKESTAQLESKEIDEVFIVLARYLGKKFELHVDFPSIEALINEQRLKEQP